MTDFAEAPRPARLFIIAFVAFAVAAEVLWIGLLVWFLASLF
jgi:hypothetical protein